MNGRKSRARRVIGSFTRWALRSGEVACRGDHSAIVSSCPACKASL